jgi:phthalate 4,5-dioxygenase oxygenase subunit
MAACIAASLGFDDAAIAPAAQFTQFVIGIANMATDAGFFIADKRGYFRDAGIAGLAMQDASIQESKGPIQDRTRENLVSTDNAIIMAHLLLGKVAEGVAMGGRAPGPEAAAQNVRSASFVLPEHASFHDTALDAAGVRKGEPHVAV